MKKIKKGFTLLELMLVISIIIVLAGFLLPKFVGYHERAKTVKSINTAKQIYTAALGSYADQDGEFIPSDVAKTIKELTGVEEDLIETVKNNEDNIEVKFKSDKDEYSVLIDASDSTYVVKKEGTQIFPQSKQEKVQSINKKD